MNRVLMIAAVAVGALGSSSHVEAQSYYARQKLQEVRSSPASQYPGRWTSSSTTSECVGGSKTTTTTATCSGGTCDPSMDPSSVVPETCSRTCRPLQAGYVYSPSGSSPSTEIYGTSLSDLLTKARQFCDAASTAGGCLFGVYNNDPAARKGNVWVVKPIAKYSASNTSEGTTYFYGSICS